MHMYSRGNDQTTAVATLHVAILYENVRIWAPERNMTYAQKRGGSSSSSSIGDVITESHHVTLLEYSATSLPSVNRSHLYFVSEFARSVFFSIYYMYARQLTQLAIRQWCITDSVAGVTPSTMDWISLSAFCRLLGL